MIKCLFIFASLYSVINFQLGYSKNFNSFNELHFYFVFNCLIYFCNVLLWTKINNFNSVKYPVSQWIAWYPCQNACAKTSLILVMSTIIQCIISVLGLMYQNLANQIHSLGIYYIAGREYLADILDRHVSRQAYAKHFRTSTWGRMTHMRYSGHPREST